MDAGDLQVREDCRELGGVFLSGLQFNVQFLIFFHHGADYKYLSPFLHLLSDKSVEPGSVTLIYGKGVHLLPSGR